MKVYAVNRIHTPWVSHGYEPEAMFSTREKADAYAATLTARIDPHANPEQTGVYGYEVEEWGVDTEGGQDVD